MATIYKHDGTSRYLGVPFRDLTEAEVADMRPLHQRIVKTSGAWKAERVKAAEAEAVAPVIADATPTETPAPKRDSKKG